MSQPSKRWGWLAGKTVLTVIILFFVGRQFYRDLTDPGAESLPRQPGWMLLSACLYLIFLALLHSYWRHLLFVCDQRPGLLTTLRAYYIALLGKYAPGKAWALLLRGTLVRGPNVRLGVAILTSFFEVLTSMS